MALFNEGGHGLCHEGEKDKEPKDKEGEKPRHHQAQIAKEKETQPPTQKGNADKQPGKEI
ncbi:hypothetical protein NHP190012_12970 [Helicobacter sp. NHP19-012]|uniref:Uncharacterized protein n=1 Tax=Helicobacter gastrofelis TaxID=2849642 RepID=A0ABM7SNI4_9HELI|nr:hypothetical protein NHP190012_12970 [Helicobacter sp. NHP19-012]